jgi:hypothetical protein
VFEKIVYNNERDNRMGQICIRCQGNSQAIVLANVQVKEFIARLQIFRNIILITVVVVINIIVVVVA